MAACFYIFIYKFYFLVSKFKTVQFFCTKLKRLCIFYPFDTIKPAERCSLNQCSFTPVDEHYRSAFLFIHTRVCRINMSN